VRKLEAPHVPATVRILGTMGGPGVFDAFDIQFAALMKRLAPGLTDDALWVMALAARAPRLGSVCLRLDDSPETSARPPEEWQALLFPTGLVATPSEAHRVPLRPLVLDHNRLYLHRYWVHETRVADELATRAASRGVTDGVDELLGELFEPEHHEQRAAARRALTDGLSVIAGGPGTGKTHTVARILVAALRRAQEEGHDLDVALVAPTGKAASRMGEAVRSAVVQLQESGVVDRPLAERLAALEPSTIHRLLGSRRGVHVHHDRRNPLNVDLVVVDETSMVALPLMARLLDALPAEADLVLVGDPFQLTSIEAGTVMDDIVGPAGRATAARLLESDDRWEGPLRDRVTVLTTTHRFADDSGIFRLAEAVRAGDAGAALAVLENPSDDLVWIEPGDETATGLIDAELLAAARLMVEAARAGEAAEAIEAASSVKVLAATRMGPGGVREWSERIKEMVKPDVARSGLQPQWFAGRPVLVTGNDPGNRVFNGDVGVTVATPDGGLAVAFPEADGECLVGTSRLADVEDWYAMTIHKSQGSEFDHVVVSLPRVDSRVLTQELLYTAITRARRRLTVVASREVLEKAIEHRAPRASGLGERLWGSEQRA